MTRYIERLNRVEAIQNNGDYVEKIIPFLREHGISFEYKENLTDGKHLDVAVNGGTITLNKGEYLVVSNAGVDIFSSEYFKREFEEYVDLHKHITDLEGKLSKAMADIELIQARTPIQSLATSLSNSYGK